RFSISFCKAADSNFFIHKTPHTYNIPFLQSDTTRETKKAARLLLPPSGSCYHRSGKPKDLRCSFQSSGIFFIICAMDNPSGSAPFTIASTMSGARLYPC
ncbi:MAG: hypothetical protein IKA22_01885, partial [Lentisphaeria bacterium]|nr:hypothetical protein [Lentisphaeria bacterium]